MNKEEAKQGEIVEVENKQRERGEDAYYYSVWVDRGGVKVPLLMTFNEFDALHSRADHNKGDMPKLVKRKSK